MSFGCPAGYRIYILLLCYLRQLQLTPISNRDNEVSQRTPPPPPVIFTDPPHCHFISVITPVMFTAGMDPPHCYFISVITPVMFTAGMDPPHCHFISVITPVMFTVTPLPSHVFSYFTFA